MDARRGRGLQVVHQRWRRVRQERDPASVRLLEGVVAAEGVDDLRVDRVLRRRGVEVEHGDDESLVTVRFRATSGSVRVPTSSGFKLDAEDGWDGGF